LRSIVAVQRRYRKKKRSPSPGPYPPCDSSHPRTAEPAIAAKDLIFLSRAYSNLQGKAGVDALLQTLVTAASDAVAKYCRRDFLSTIYDEL
jgi:hypothetical protein